MATDHYLSPRVLWSLGEARSDKGRRDRGRKELRLLWPINKTVAAGMEWNGSGELGRQPFSSVLGWARINDFTSGDR